MAFERSEGSLDGRVRSRVSGGWQGGLTNVVV
jgi:hypothetical protein